MEESLPPVSPSKRPSPLSFSYGLVSTPQFSTVTKAFFHYASTQPQALAARDLSVEPAVQITYGELARRSAKLARKLQTLGVTPGSRIPLVVKRGIDMLVGIFSILACGAQYVPLDGSVVPDETLQFVLEQTGGCTALALKSTRHRLANAGVANVVVVDDLDNADEDEIDEEEGFVDLASPESGCYVIYTSGVNVTHRNVTNLICHAPGNLGISPGKRVGQVLNISFDMAAWETLGCLSNGGTLIIRGSDWTCTLKEIDILICTPTILSLYNPQDYPRLKTVATAGEPSSQRLADTWAAQTTYYNCCGPTETTIVNTMHQHQPGLPLTIGRPTPNNNVYILDQDLVPVEVGQSGVMWAGGLGVSSGYVGIPEITAERYVLDPFAQKGSKMYNTGDVCQWNPDGSVHILGRVDDQVKVKGFRVELDGIAASLTSCHLVQRAAALLIEGEIHGFLTPSHCRLSVVKDHMKDCQPYYAMPSHYHLLESLPMTENGKVDKRALRTLALAGQDSTECENLPSHLINSPQPADLEQTQSDSSSSSVTQVSTYSEKLDSTVIEKDSDFDLEAVLPEKKHRKYARGLRYRGLIVYRRLLSLVGLFNITAAIALVLTGITRQWLGNITAINLATAVLIRQDFVINTLYTIACSVPKSWPLFVRARCGKIYHLGGVHSGAAISAGGWLLATNIADIVCMSSGSSCSNWGHQSVEAKVVSWMLAMLFVVMITLAWPTMRKKHHDLFEMTHRFVGWTMLALFWVQVVLTNKDSAPEGVSLGSACLRSPSFWLLAVSTASVASSWLFLRKVPVEAEVLSDHAVRLHFDYTVPVNGSFARLSRRPLIEWHSFATIPAPEANNNRPKGYSLVVSNAGDWTKSTIRQPPTHIWTRGVPTCGVMRIATLFNRVVLIATGSGIGPVLGHINNLPYDTQLIWSTSRPEQTFGDELCNSIIRQIPDAVIHDTKKLGRPDLVKMGFNLAKSFKAEAVIIIANEKITKKVVYGLETRGVPAYGAIWDS
ncbi:hypothetical protein BGZ61DRAFT_503019 [Ilyonectria robusta]|uniref:uncharacterized protein n=1 Tax=Ilyonectria robusta TaxID=1079257 RepID=UPI001E8D5D15|nr:uncharacterized protein BGZ61DRAFT_503019 [Ilyonectria robusta]KAH8736610.1 hypothetical protein BGZ61DRAFT_503019 [Ilyonectria robusta]